MRDPTEAPEPRAIPSGADVALPSLPGPLDPEERSRLVTFLRARTRPVEPLPPPDLPEPFASLSGRPLPRRPRALILDVYGTLLVSGAGEVGTAVDIGGPGPDGLAAVLEEFGVPGGADRFEEGLREEIRKEHERARAAGVPWPEVDGAALLARLAGKTRPVAQVLGAAREAVLNPSAPMPGAEALLKAARRAGLVLGIVSNAQYYTEPALEAAFGRSLGALGFSPDLCVWSWRLGRAKPDPELFRILARSLEVRGIEPESAVYVGNDLLNDVAPARACGYRTALFAGDARSLRLRPGDPRTEGILPDTVLPSFHGAAAVFRLAGRDPFRCAPRRPEEFPG